MAHAMLVANHRPVSFPRGALKRSLPCKRERGRKANSPGRRRHTRVCARRETACASPPHNKCQSPSHTANKKRPTTHHRPHRAMREHTASTHPRVIHATGHAFEPGPALQFTHGPSARHAQWHLGGGKDRGQNVPRQPQCTVVGPGLIEAPLSPHRNQGA